MAADKVRCSSEQPIVKGGWKGSQRFWEVFGQAGKLLWRVRIFMAVKIGSEDTKPPLGPLSIAQGLPRAQSWSLILESPRHPWRFLYTTLGNNSSKSKRPHQWEMENSFLGTFLKYLMHKASSKGEKILLGTRFLLLTMHMSEYNWQKINTSKRLFFPICIFEIEFGRWKEWTQNLKLTDLVMIHVFEGRTFLCILLVFLSIILQRQKIYTNVLYKECFLNQSFAGGGMWTM